MESILRHHYFKHSADIGLGYGVAYMEFEGEWAIRQVEIYGEQWFCSLQDYHPELGPGLVDQPFSVLELQPEHEVSEAEFLAVWQEAIRRMQ